MEKFFIAFIVVAVIGLTIFLFLDFQGIFDSSGKSEENIPTDEFIQCLVDSGMVVYASKTCPACSSLASLFGGYDSVQNLFVLCSEERDRCNTEMESYYVPEIQINGELFEGEETLKNFAAKTGCAY